MLELLNLIIIKIPLKESLIVRVKVLDQDFGALSSCFSFMPQFRTPLLASQSLPLKLSHQIHAQEMENSCFVYLFLK